MRRSPWVAALVVAAALVATGAGWWLMDQRAAPSPASEGQGRVPGIRTREVQLVGRHRGQLQWQLHARSIEMPAASEEVAFSTVQDGAFYRAGQIFLRFEGDGGRWEPDAGRLLLQGRYTLTHPGGAVLESQDLVWEAERQRLTSPGPNALRYDSTTVEAPLLEVDVAAGVIRLSGGVRLDDSTGRGLQAWAEAAEYLPDSGEIRLLGPVRLEGEATR
ncbi:LPS export ABC transporter periplasmic protein LptC [Geochorda subterranea]|uniref:LPS export ABC transporter periplasmic protein LptC n=1 Tax=Geochorda subterranea TaxID=3109564 RepID=A0ABZ1BQ62_9FIRM|nr:LPS export ABC transporter periplasmic protein LptC [Limnochorda sp. LNt]WRP14854.1 LPS export ABC transporter periplasmic protein LptC [Limnochorda sp. LNt]